MSWRERLGRNWGRLGMRFNIWKDCPKVPITELLSFIVDNRGKTVPTADDGWKLIATNCVTNNTLFPVYEKVRYLTQETYETWFRAHPMPGDILFVNKGTPGRVCLVPDPVDFCIAQDMIALRADDEKIYNKYLFAVLRSREIQQQIYNTNVGDVIPHFKKQFMDQLLIPVPDRRIQEIIGNLYYELSYKTELNKKINNNLLEQALTLYATHFSSVDKNGCIGDYCAVKSGFAFKSSWWTNNGVKVIKIGSINQDNLNLLECSYVDEDKADKAKDFVVKAGDLLIAMTGATIGKFSMVPYSSEVLLVNQRVGKFFLGNHPVKKLPFIYCTLKQPEVYNEVVNRGQGSAQPNISASDIMSIPCVIPSQDVINDFNDAAQPLFDLIISNQRENQQLSELRNTLLPKLMSGELDVSNIDL